MTVDQQVQWVTLPGGPTADGAALALSVVVAPRLRTDEAPLLATFPDWLDWPARVRDATFALDLGGGEALAATVVGEPPDSELWSALFTPETPVTPFVFDDHADRPFVTFSVLEVLGWLKTTYARIAGASPDALPPIHGREHAEPPVQGLLDHLDELRRVARGLLHRGVGSERALDERVRILLDRARDESARRRAPGAVRGGPLLEPLPPDGTPAGELERALLFHRRRGGVPTAMPPDGDHYRATVDFHQMISALGDHPWLMRRLGLIVDVTVDSASVPEAQTIAPGQLAVRPTWSSTLAAGSADVVPLTAYARLEVDGETFFAAAPQQPDPTAPAGAPPTGLLSLPSAAFAVQQVDVDGAALKTLNLAATLEAAAQRPDPETRSLHEPDTAGVPALRTSGLALVEAGRASSLQDLFGRHVGVNEGIEHGVPPVLFADDLVRGYRLDVLDDVSTAWRSLHRRVVAAEAERLGRPLPGVTDEGFFQLSLAGPPVAPGQAPDPNGELYVHETLITWDGWSLSAPRVGKSLSRDPRAPTDGEPETQPQTVPNDSFTAMGLRLETAVAAGTLPRLRFGRGYRFRVRTVDLAGNGPTLEQADRRLASPAMATPALPPADVAPYLRFEPVPAPALVPTARFGEGASLRRLVIRSAPGVAPEPYAADFNASELVTVEGHPPYDPHDDRHVAAPKAAYELVERHGRLDAIVGSDGSAPDADRRAAIRAAYEVARREKGSFDDPTLPGVEVIELSSDPLDPQRYVIHPEEQLELPYLPDPQAGAALFFGLPRQPPDEPFAIAFDTVGAWYEARPFRLRLTGGHGAPQWDPDTRVLTVALPQAATAAVRVCSVIGDKLDLMGILRWCEETLDGPDLERVLSAAKDNRCWLITPWLELELVHAVQRPLAPPALGRFRFQRNAGVTNADLIGEAELDVPSTEKIDVVATWSETVDDPLRAGPEERLSDDVVFDLSLAVAATGPSNFGLEDTPYSLRDERLLTFNTAVARSLNLAPPRAHEFGDTHHRTVTYTLLATTSFREDFPVAWKDRRDRLTVASEPQTFDLPSTAPPAVPHLLYAVPTLGWEAEEAGDTTVRRRRGGGLRVYLDRPWFSSGDGELLGVVVGSSLVTPRTDAYPFVTLVGEDPVRAGAPLEVATAASFRNAALVARGVSLLELAEQVIVVAFEPAYDAETGRWFCDVDLDTGDAYLPFIRLALARYQPSSLAGCHLSRVVLVDVVQTLPDRTLTVTRDGQDALEISLTGPTYSAIRGLQTRADAASLGRVTARVERREAEIPDELLGWRAVPDAETELVRAATGDVGIWSGRLSVPAADGAQQRVVVLEEDHLAVDEDTPGQDGLGARLVYADAFVL